MQRRGQGSRSFGFRVEARQCWDALASQPLKIWNLKPKILNPELYVLNSKPRNPTDPEPKILLPGLGRPDPEDPESPKTLNPKP